IAYARVQGFATAQVYLFDRTSGTHTLISVNNSGVAGNGHSGVVFVSKALIPQSIGTSVTDDGRYVAFSSVATNLGGASPGMNVFVRDTLSGTTSPANIDA